MDAAWKSDHLWLCLLALGFNPTLRSLAELGRDMFDIPNSRAFSVIARFLFTKWMNAVQEKLSGPQYVDTYSGNVTSLKKEKEVVDSVLEDCVNPCILDGAGVVLSVPGLLTSTVERNIYGFCTGNLYEDGNLNFLTVIQLLNEALMTLRDEHSPCELTEVHRIEDVVTCYKNALQELKTSSLRRREQHYEPKHQSISRKQEIWESKWKTFLGQCPFNLICKDDPQPGSSLQSSSSSDEDVFCQSFSEKTGTASTQTVTEEKGTKNKATMSVSTQAVTEEKETKAAISISTQTVTEAEQPRPVAVASVQKKKSKSKSVRIVTDEDVAGPLHPAEETEPEIITHSLSLGELRDLRREFTRQTNESILTWLLRIWDAAANDTILDGSEARQLGSLSRDVVVDQGIGRTQQTLSLWRRLLTSVRDRYLCKEDLQMHQGKWSTMEQVSQAQNSRRYKKNDMTDPLEGTSGTYLQEESNMYYDQEEGGPASSQVEERDNRIYWTVWIQWPGTSDPQKDTALVDTGAQCTLMPSRYVGTESISISGVTGGSQQLTVFEAEVSLTGSGWQNHPIVTGPEAPCILGIHCLRNRYFKDPEGYCWAFGIAAVETEDIRQLNTLPGLSDDSSAVGLLRAEEQVPIATAMVRRWQYRTDRDSVIPIHEMIRKLESQGVVSKAHSPFSSPVWPVYMLELQYELESKAAKWYATIDIANAFFSIPLAAECRAQFAFT
ncbi:hypothetical protein DUI87_03893 [Hirundo rustica rustica]|uniref:Peptidase A2 domain-containing protein n=1 Tax=Hirundo rustica rustica TaxID=333673 RepID=A0A3M0L2G7_HIRRU|nr:hypothetical protein DUI87_03893 [Hirundo rustica rustica]